MRPLGAGLALTLTLLALAASPALANPTSGNLQRGEAEDEVRITLRNDGGAADQQVAVVFPEGTEVLSVELLQGPPSFCFVQGNKRTAQCNFNDPFWQPGGTIVLKVRTKPRLADNAGAQVFVSSGGGNTGGPFDIAGPSGGADLGLTLAADNKAVSAFTGTTESYATMLIRGELINHGPDAASGVSLLLSTPDLPTGSHTLVTTIEEHPSLGTVVGFSPHPECAAQPALGATTCEFGGSAPGGIDRVMLVIRVFRPGVVRARGAASADTFDPGPKPNQAEQGFTIARLPVSDNGRLAPSFKVFDGVARGASNVAVGVAEVEGGAQPGPPKKEAAAPGGRAGAAATAGCRWLTSTRVRFRRERGKRCDEPSYLRAKVRKGRWKLKLRKRLPPGRYVMITRAIGPGGLIESGVSRKRGNLVRFSVP